MTDTVKEKWQRSGKYLSWLGLQYLLYTKIKPSLRQEHIQNPDTSDKTQQIDIK